MCLVYPMLPVSLCCSFMIVPSVYSSVYFVQCHVHPMLPLSLCCSFFIVPTRVTRRNNQEWTTQRQWQHRIHKTQNKINTRVNRRDNQEWTTPWLSLLFTLVFILFSVLCIRCCQCLCVVHSWLSLLFTLVFILYRVMCIRCCRCFCVVHSSLLGTMKNEQHRDSGNIGYTWHCTK
jgi:hypothetical protein